MVRVYSDSDECLLKQDVGRTTIVNQDRACFEVGNLHNNHQGVVKRVEDALCLSH